MHGGERGPVTFPAFKAGDSVLRGSNGGFDFHTPPPNLLNSGKKIRIKAKSGPTLAENRIAKGRPPPGAAR
jgi:hypothetical protein